MIVPSAGKLGRGVVAAAVSTALLTSVAVAHSIQGPSSSEAPYVVRSLPGVVSRSILTVGDAVNSKPDGTPYRLVGIPDGLGAYDNGDGTFTLLVNHEVPAGRGAQRAHGAPGAFVSKWTIEKGSLRVLHGEDLIRQVATWNPATGRYNQPTKGVAISRLCSADLPEPGAFYDRASGVGYEGRLFMNGEEAGPEGRAFAHALDGTSYELPALGKASWENLLANPATGRKTVVVGLDDSSGGQVYIYVGDKQATGNPAERAGLANGVLYGLKIEGVARETDDTVLAGPVPFSLHAFGDVRNWTGARLEQESALHGVTSFQRPEDGAWDPRNPRDFYFVTTASIEGKSRLWRLRFIDPANPAAGGTVELLLDGTEGAKMMDNLTITRRGQILIQEDPGNHSRLAKIWRYDIDSGRLEAVAEHDPDRFTPGAGAFLTQDEESSGIIDASHLLGEGWFLLTVQAHYKHPDPELVEGGQLLALHVPPGKGSGGDGPRHRDP